MSENITSRVNGDVPLLDASAASQGIPASSTIAISGFGSVGYPKAIPKALTRDDRELSLTLISGGAVGEEVDTDLVEANAIARRYPYQSQPESRKAINERNIAFQDQHISTLEDSIRFGPCSLDVAIVEAVAVGEDWFVPTTSIGPVPGYVAEADRLIVEVNHAQPLTLQYLHDVYRLADPPNRESIPLSGAVDRINSPRISFDPTTLEAVVETDSRDRPYEFRTPGEVEHAIGLNVIRFLNREAEENPLFRGTVHLQFGVGSIGNALMGNFEDMDFGTGDVVYFGEVIQDGLLDALDDGAISAASATSLALSTDGQSRLFEKVRRYADDIVLRPSNVSNAPSLINRFGVVGINSALEVDIYGNANTTHINGTHIVNGIGGGGDFVRNAQLSIIALPSTTKDTELSRIVPMVPHVDHTDHDIDIIITDQGVADLRGLSPSERAELIVARCSHPSFEDELRAYIEHASEMAGHIPHDLKKAYSWYTRRADN